MQVANSPLCAGAFFTGTAKCSGTRHSEGQAAIAIDNSSSATQAARYAAKTQSPRSDRRNCTSKTGIARSLKNESSPCQRSSHVTSAQSVPMAPSRNSKTGRPPGAADISRLNSSAVVVGKTARSQITRRMPVADVDHGNDTATAIIKPSAARRSLARSNSSVRAIIGID